MLKQVPVKPNPRGSLIKLSLNVEKCVEAMDFLLLVG